MHTAAWRWRQSGKQSAARCRPFQGYVKLCEHGVSVRTNWLLYVRFLRRTNCLLLWAKDLTVLTSLVQFQLKVVVASAIPFRRLSTNTISMYFVGFIFTLLILVQFSACFISASLLLLFTAGTIMYESSANLSISLPGVMDFRSDALTTYEAGPMLDPSLHDASCNFMQWRDVSFVLCARVSSHWRKRPSSCLNHMAWPASPWV